MTGTSQTARRSSARQRRGAVLVEVAIIGPVAFLLILSLIIGGIAVFRAHQVTALAQEGARWASVHGFKYASRKGQALPDKDEVFRQAMEPISASLQREQLVYDVVYDQSRMTVTVHVTYYWNPKVFRRNFAFRGVAEVPVVN